MSFLASPLKSAVDPAGAAVPPPPPSSSVGSVVMRAPAGSASNIATALAAANSAGMRFILDICVPSMVSVRCSPSHGGRPGVMGQMSRWSRSGPEFGRSDHDHQGVRLDPEGQGAGLAHDDAVEAQREGALQLDLHGRRPPLPDPRMGQVGAVAGPGPHRQHLAQRQAGVEGVEEPVAGMGPGPEVPPPTHWAFMATNALVQSLVRATSEATNRWIRPSASTTPEVDGEADADQLPAPPAPPPRVRHRSPPSRPSGG